MLTDRQKTAIASTPAQQILPIDEFIIVPQFGLILRFIVGAA
jgi:hypothetical protein